MEGFMKTSASEWVGCGLAATFSAIQENPVFSIISWVLTILATVVTLAFTIWKWWKKSKEDGKITKEEIKEGIEIVADGAKEIADQIDEIKEAKKDGNKD